jgi:DNA-binding NarL/FixJ family response regulator
MLHWKGRPMPFLNCSNWAEVVRIALKTGALGYVVKSLIETDLLVAIHEALAARAFVSVEASVEE